MVDLYRCEVPGESITLDDTWVAQCSYVPNYGNFWYWKLIDDPDLELKDIWTPGYMYDRVDVSISSIEKDFLTGYLTIEFCADNKFLFLDSNNELSDKQLSETIDVYINDVLYESFQFNSNGYYDDQTFSFVWEENSNLTNLNMEFIISDNYDIGFNESEKISVNTIFQSEYNISFDESLTQTILTPIAYVDNEVIYEEIIFKKLFPDIFEYPQELSDLLMFEYNDYLNNYFPNFKNSVDITISLDGYTDISSNIKCKWDNSIVNPNKYLLSVDDYMYYNEKYQQVWKGNSSEYIVDKSIVIPWDYSNNYGHIYFTFYLNSYQNYVFNFTLNVGNEYKLRGENGRYYFIAENIYE